MKEPMMNLNVSETEDESEKEHHALYYTNQ